MKKVIFSLIKIKQKLLIRLEFLSSKGREDLWTFFRFLSEWRRRGRRLAWRHDGAWQLRNTMSSDPSWVCDSRYLEENLVRILSVGAVGTSWYFYLCILSSLFLGRSWWHSLVECPPWIHSKNLHVLKLTGGFLCPSYTHEVAERSGGWLRVTLLERDKTAICSWTCQAPHRLWKQLTFPWLDVSHRN